MRHRVKGRYANTNKHRGKVLKDKEIARRIAQSYGYKHTIHDQMPMIQLMARAGIFLEGYQYEEITDGVMGVSSERVELDKGFTHTSITERSNIDKGGDTIIVS